MSTAPRTKLIAAFAALYFVWGSTYLFIRWAVETLPPIGMAGIRFLIAGSVLYAWVRWRGAERPTAIQWRSSAIVGALLMSSNACVAFLVPSGVASLLVGMTPAWMVLIDWMRPAGHKPRSGVFVGLAAGAVGVLILVGPGQLAGGEPFNLLGAGILVLGSLVWSFGSIYSRHAPRPSQALQGSAMHMLCGGAWLVLVSLATGQFRGFSFAQVSTRSWIAFVYLIIFGSLVGFSAFVYLLRVTTPARVATYAYVNPMVAVLLGWLFADETLSLRVLLAALVIIGAVALITTFGGEAGKKPSPVKDSCERADAAVVEEVP
jgi:drug/metabolite transporter (DMT)-like permease